MEAHVPWLLRGYPDWLFGVFAACYAVVTAGALVAWCGLLFGG